MRRLRWLMCGFAFVGMAHEAAAIYRAIGMPVKAIGALANELESLLGRTGAEAVQALVASAAKPSSGVGHA